MNPSKRSIPARPSVADECRGRPHRNHYTPSAPDRRRYPRKGEEPALDRGNRASVGCRWVDSMGFLGQARAEPGMESSRGGRSSAFRHRSPWPRRAIDVVTGGEGSLLREPRPSSTPTPVRFEIRGTAEKQRRLVASIASGLPGSSTAAMEATVSGILISFASIVLEGVAAKKSKSGLTPLDKVVFGLDISAWLIDAGEFAVGK